MSRQASRTRETLSGSRAGTRAATRFDVRLNALTRTSGRAARFGAFALETWSRLAAGHAVDPRERARELSWVAENTCALHGVRIHLRGQVPSEPCVLVANHITYFDPIVLASLVPLTAVAKREVASWPIIGELTRKLGTLYVSRGSSHSGARCLREALRALEQGVSVLVFPEGTTTTGERVLPLQRGVFGAAALAGVPVVPVSLSYDRPSAAWIGEDPFLRHYLEAIRHPCTRVDVRFLAPIHVASTADAAAAAESARSALELSLQGSRAEAYASLASDSFASRATPEQDAWHLVSA